jgi:spore coat polysaccharide biosynthesis protein SpsF
MKKRTVAIVQARVGSSRLPRKVLEPIAGMPVLGWVVRRVRRARQLDDVIVATTECDADEEIVALCKQLGVGCFRGSENDVLDRFVQAARWAEASHVVRINADNPLVDPQYVDGLLAEAGAWDYISYETSDRRPVMLTALSFFSELVTCECLERADREILDIRLREHVTLGVYRAPDRFRVRFLGIPSFAEDQRLRLTLDTLDDLNLLREIVGGLGDDPQGASAESIVEQVSRRLDWLARMEELNRQNRKS